MILLKCSIKNCFIVRSEQWYDPTKVQYKELHGMLGFPVKLAKSFILSSKPTLLKRILFVLRWDQKFHTFLSVSVRLFIIQWFFSLKSNKYFVSLWTSVACLLKPNFSYFPCFMIFFVSYFLFPFPIIPAKILSHQFFVQPLEFNLF